MASLPLPPPPPSSSSSSPAPPPLPFALRYQPAECQRGTRKIQSRAGGKLHLRKVIQTSPPSPPLGDAAGSSSSHGPKSGSVYVLDRIVAQQPQRGVTVLLANPMTCLSSDPSSPRLVSSGDPVVIKAVPRPIKGDRLMDSPLQEIAAMQALMQQRSRHGSIIRLLDAMQDQDFIYLVLPFLTGGDLFAKVEDSRGCGLPEALAAHYFRQMCEALLFMKQSCRMAHHDISLENVLITEEGEDHVQLIDLGMCVQVPEGASLVAPVPSCGKPAYISPEVVREEPWDPFAADIWSLGICLYMMLTARPLYGTPDDAAFKIMSSGGVVRVVEVYETYGLRLPPFAKQLVCWMLDADPTRRPTLEEVLAHPFLVGTGGDGATLPGLLCCPSPASPAAANTTDEHRCGGLTAEKRIVELQ